jgi:8-oxo-dGTP pyrophosphatase MutT (NUDIX family)
VTTDPEILYPGRWALLGGTIEPRERPHDAAVRETLEEAGIQVAETQVRVFEVLRSKTRIRYVWVVRGVWHARDIRRGEGQDMAFYTPREALRLRPPRYQSDILRRFATRQSASPGRPSQDMSHRSVSSCR